MSVTPRPRPESRPGSSPSIPSEQKRSASWLGRLGKAMAYLDRFGRDALGLGLLVLAALSLIGMTSLSQGSLITPWGLLLKRGLGLGGYGLVLFLAYLGDGYCAVGQPPLQLSCSSASWLWKVPFLPG